MHYPRIVLALATALSAAGFTTAQPASSTDLYHVTQVFHVGGQGGWDYLTVDPVHQLLYVPRSTHTLVLDSRDGHVVADIPGQERNHGVALVPSAGRGFITDGKAGDVVVFDLKTYAVLGKIKAAPDADGIIYDRGSGKVMAVCGDAGVVVPISPDVDPVHGHADPAIPLGGKPEFLASDGRGRLYINLVNKAEVAVVDTKAMRVIAHWPTAPGGVPVGMAIDRAHHRLFIGCRRPQTLLVMNADNGDILAHLPLGAGNDAVKFDNGRALASCGDGTLTVAGETAPGQYGVLQVLKTRPGARTCGVDPRRHIVYLPTAEFGPRTGHGRPPLKPGSFMIVKVTRKS